MTFQFPSIHGALTASQPDSRRAAPEHVVEPDSQSPLGIQSPRLCFLETESGMGTCLEKVAGGVTPMKKASRIR